MPDLVGCNKNCYKREVCNNKCLHLKQDSQRTSLMSSDKELECLNKLNPGLAEGETAVHLLLRQKEIKEEIIIDAEKLGHLEGVDELVERRIYQG